MFLAGFSRVVFWMRALESVLKFVVFGNNRWSKTDRTLERVLPPRQNVCSLFSFCDTVPMGPENCEEKSFWIFEGDMCTLRVAGLLTHTHTHTHTHKKKITFPWSQWGQENGACFRTHLFFARTRGTHNLHYEHEIYARELAAPLFGLLWLRNFTWTHVDNGRVQVT